MSKIKNIYGAMLGCSVLPALVICAANAEDATFKRGNNLGAYYLQDKDTLSHADLLRDGEFASHEVRQDGGIALQISNYNSYPGSNNDYGAFYVYINNTKDISVVDSVFDNNVGTVSAAASIWTHGGKESALKTYIKNTQFTNNTGSGNGAAGAILFAPEADFKFLGNAELSNVVFDGNKAENGMGGAIQDQNHNMIVSDSVFKNNVAKNGGAVYLFDVDNITAGFENATFENNHASQQGGAIYNPGKGSLEFRGTNTFTGNTAAAGADIFNDGVLTVASGVTSVDGGITGNGAMIISDGATVNIGDATIEQKSIVLDGNMIANLTAHGDTAIITAETFTGNGTMSLIARSVGEYVVFGDAAFDGEKDVNFNSALYNMYWQDNTVILGLKSVEEIASANGLPAELSQTVANLVSATSDKLNDLGLLVQENLSNGDVAAVEKVHKVINPEKTAAVQSVASHVQGTVAKLAVNRMSVPTMTGRAGGDVNMTAGGLWAQGLFNKSKLNGGFHGYTRGVSAGIDGTINRVFTIGAGYAYNYSDLNLTSRDAEIDSNTLFVYGQYKPSQWYANAILNYTMSDYTENAWAASDLGVVVGSDYKINSFGGQVMTGYDFATGFSPEIGARYMYLKGDIYNNSLGVQNKIDDADYLTAIVGGKFAKTVWIGDMFTMQPELRLAAKYDLISDNVITSVFMPGISAYSINGERLNRFGGEAGVGITMSYNAFDLSVSYDIEVRKDYTSQTGMVKARYNF